MRLPAAFVHKFVLNASAQNSTSYTAVKWLCGYSSGHPNINFIPVAQTLPLVLLGTNNLSIISINTHYDEWI